MMRDMLPERATGKRAAKLAVIALAAGTMLAGCGGGSTLGSSSGSSSSSSLGDRFGQIFGSKSQAVGEAPPPPEVNELTCPSVDIRFGASTLPVGLPGKPASGNDLRYQASVVRTARDCTLSGNEVRARVGIQGRVIVGPAGAPPTVTVPIRVALVEAGIHQKVIFSKAYQTNVDMSQGDGNTDFSFVAEDIVYPAPSAAVGDKYIFYVGFDPQGLKPERPARGRKR
ncbi:hypothetical protein [Afipia sp. Root123D2]|uniref:hypothetical protein n=1 Tax=Afipia sp. Root123D2 TaxID=1736436 RepID=UPI000AE51059|nr:hypothetical protein [Afipia sp. Root123D2]